jgi:hypothetical protein
MGNFLYDLYPNYELSISGKCHLSHCDKRIESLILSERMRDRYQLSFELIVFCPGGYPI